MNTTTAVTVLTQPTKLKLDDDASSSAALDDREIGLFCPICHLRDPPQLRVRLPLAERGSGEGGCPEVGELPDTIRETLEVLCLGGRASRWRLLTRPLHRPEHAH